MTAAESLDPDESLWNALAFHLRYERIRRGLSQSQMGLIIGVNKFGVSNLEAGRNKLTQPQADRLDREWDTGGLFGRLRRFARLNHDPDWKARLERYQRQAIQIKTFHNNFIPLPFQTEDYGRSLLTAGYSVGLVDDVEASLAHRMELQAAMLGGKSRAPQIWAVLDEVALRQMGEPAIMKAQIAQMVELSRLRNVSLRVLPLTAAPHIGIDGPFTFFELTGHRLAAFAGTTLDVGRVIDDQAEAAGVDMRFERIAARAWNEDQTHDLLTGMCEDL